MHRILRQNIFLASRAFDFYYIICHGFRPSAINLPNSWSALVRLSITRCRIGLLMVNRSAVRLSTRCFWSILFKERYLSFLLRYHHPTGEKSALTVVTQTLNAMAKGGIFDQLGGVFHHHWYYTFDISTFTVVISSTSPWISTLISPVSISCKVFYINLLIRYHKSM